MSDKSNLVKFILIKKNTWTSLKKQKNKILHAKHTFWNIKKRNNNSLLYNICALKERQTIK